MSSSTSFAGGARAFRRGAPSIPASRSTSKFSLTDFVLADFLTDLVLFFCFLFFPLAADAASGRRASVAPEAPTMAGASTGKFLPLSSFLPLPLPLSLSLSLSLCLTLLLLFQLPRPLRDRGRGSDSPRPGSGHGQRSQVSPPPLPVSLSLSLSLSLSV